MRYFIFIIRKLCEAGWSDPILNPKLTKKQRSEIEKLALMSDGEIDTSEIPEMADWKNPVIGKFYRPVKKQVSLHLDADMLEWFKVQGGKYQTHINQVLRRYMEVKQASK